jgi:hypothetical protein
VGEEDAPRRLVVIDDPRRRQINRNPNVRTQDVLGLLGSRPGSCAA